MRFAKTVIDTTLKDCRKKARLSAVGTHAFYICTMDFRFNLGSPMTADGDVRPVVHIAGCKT